MKRMQANLIATKGFVHAESVMLALSAKLGKQSAHALVYRAAMRAAKQDLTLQEAVLAEANIVAALGVKEIEALFDLRGSSGCCARMVDSVVAETRAWNWPAREGKP